MVIGLAHHGYRPVDAVLPAGEGRVGPLRRLEFVRPGLKSTVIAELVCDRRRPTASWKTKCSKAASSRCDTAASELRRDGGCRGRGGTHLWLISDDNHVVPAQPVGCSNCARNIGRAQPRANKRRARQPARPSKPQVPTPKRRRLRPRFSLFSSRFTLSALADSLSSLVLISQLSRPPLCSTERRPCVETRNLKLRSSFSLSSVTFCRFGKNVRLVLLFAWLTLWPTWRPLPVSSQNARHDTFLVRMGGRVPLAAGAGRGLVLSRKAARIAAGLRIVKHVAPCRAGAGDSIWPRTLPQPMKRALELAEQAAALGEVPVGAVITRGSEGVIAEAHNGPRETCDPTAHAEILVRARRNHWRRTPERLRIVGHARTLRHVRGGDRPCTDRQALLRCERSQGRRGRAWRASSSSRNACTGPRSMRG